MIPQKHTKRWWLRRGRSRREVDGVCIDDDRRPQASSIYQVIAQLWVSCKEIAAVAPESSGAVALQMLLLLLLGVSSPQEDGVKAKDWGVWVGKGRGDSHPAAAPWHPGTGHCSGGGGGPDPAAHAAPVAAEGEGGPRPPSSSQPRRPGRGARGGGGGGRGGESGGGCGGKRSGRIVPRQE